MKLRTTVFLLAGYMLATVSVFAQSKVNIASLQAKPAQEAMYKLSIELERELPANAEIVLEFPEKYDLATIKIAGSNEIKGGISYETAQNKLTLKRSGLGAAIAVGEKVSIVFGPLKNPDDLSKDLWAKVVLPNQAATSTVREKIQFESYQIRQ